jgi:hypothetical protein
MLLREKQKNKGWTIMAQIGLTYMKVACLIKIMFFAIELKPTWKQLGMFKHWIEPTNFFVNNY